MRLAALLTDDRHLSEGVVQGAFAGLLAHLRSVDPQRWLFLLRSVANGARSSLGRRRTRRAFRPPPATAVDGADRQVLRAEGFDQIVSPIASRVAVTNGTADVGGVRCQVPAGWSVDTRVTDSLIRLCVESPAPMPEVSAGQSLPLPPDRSGATVTIALADSGGDITPLPADPLLSATCRDGTAQPYMLLDNQTPPGGRAAAQGEFRCAAAGPIFGVRWTLDDGSLSVSTG